MIPFYVQNEEIKEDEILSNDQRKKEMVRLIYQALDDLGYHKAAENLIKESNIPFESPLLATFRKFVLNAEYSKALSLLPQMNLSPSSFRLASFLIHKHHYLELLSNSDLTSALHLLQNDLQKCCGDSENLYKLSSLLICKDPKVLRSNIGWKDGLDARKALINMIGKECKVEGMIEGRRLEELMAQALSWERRNCKYHSKSNDDLNNFSLIKPHYCQCDDLPEKSFDVYLGHKEEIWFVKISPDSKKVASISKSSALIISPLDIKKMLFAAPHLKIDKTHNQEVNCMNWAPDSEKIVTCSKDQTIKIWCANNGKLLSTLNGHYDSILSAIFHPFSPAIFSSSLDNQIIFWKSSLVSPSSLLFPTSLSPSSLNQPTLPPSFSPPPTNSLPSSSSIFSVMAPEFRLNSKRVTELLIGKEGKNLICIAGTSKRIGVVELESKKEVKSFQERDDILSSALSSDSRYLLLNVSRRSPQLHLWDLENLELLMRYSGYQQEKYILRCCFGGENDNFLSCGSEDGKIYVWHHRQSSPVKILSLHKKPVNCVSWSSVNPCMFISASDDNTLRIWGKESSKSSKSELFNKFIVDFKNKVSNIYNFIIPRSDPQEEDLSSQKNDSENHSEVGSAFELEEEEKSDAN